MKIGLGSLLVKEGKQESRRSGLRRIEQLFDLRSIVRNFECLVGFSPFKPGKALIPISMRLVPSRQGMSTEQTHLCVLASGKQVF